MATTYKPPKMPAFPTSLEELYRTIAPYYRDQRPLDLFFEFFIVDVLGLLPSATQNAIDELTSKHPTLFCVNQWRLARRSSQNAEPV
jgi:hypothetical protein